MSDTMRGGPVCQGISTACTDRRLLLHEVQQWSLLKPRVTGDNPVWAFDGIIVNAGAMTFKRRNREKTFGLRRFGYCTVLVQAYSPAQFPLIHMTVLNVWQNKPGEVNQSPGFTLDGLDSLWEGVTMRVHEHPDITRAIEHERTAEVIARGNWPESDARLSALPWHPDDAGV